MGKGPLDRARILVLEDDYFLATDLQKELQDAGAEVLGPFSDAASASVALADGPPDCALVDLNLGQGMCFDVPRELKRRAIPFAFVTGYDRAAIPDEFAGTVRVEKPVVAQQAALVVGRLLSAERS